ncbi:trypsin-like peptidase domain-containing protein [Streptomyces sp. NPDC004327]|uniref:VMAP-C domain-containing protein n=1 Tax=Streptomyces sp. NPDC004327 TaxID=3364699 RepID=UPI00367C3564
MTTSPAWHARVAEEGGGHEGAAVLGSGFLVAPDRLLTCAHVVPDREWVSVWFPGAPGLGEVPARVAARGPWGGAPNDTGDVAVLALDRPVPVPPVVFAEPEGVGECREPVRLVAYGFPEGYEREGAQAELRVTAARQRIRDEWNQAEYWADHGQEPSYGFSGSAAMRAGDGTVVGMVAAYDPAVRNARIIPAQVLARHVPALADLVPTPGCSAEEKRRLRELVELAELCRPQAVPVGRLLHAATGRFGLVPPAAALTGLWAGVWYLLTESRPVRGQVPLADFAVRIGDQLPDDELRRAFRAWAREHRERHAEPPAHDRPGPPPAHPGRECAGGTGGVSAAASPPRRRAPAAYPYDDEPRHEAVPDSAPRAWAPILVEVRRSGADGGTVLAEVSVYRAGDRILVSERRLTKRQLKGWVVDRIDEAYEDIGDGRPLVAFALPRGWLNKDVDEWTRRPGKEAPLGCLSPVVVLDHDRRTKGRQQVQLRRMWDEMDRQPGSPLHRIACATPHRAAQLSVLLQNVRGPVGFTRPPLSQRERALHGAALDAPAPILLWPRSGCAPGGPCTGDCAGAGFLDRVAERISRLPPSELPDVIFELRKEAFVHQGPEPHWAAAGLSLVWEDPRRFPDVRPLRHSPVD